MGWGSGVYLFDSICEAVLTDKVLSKEEVIEKVMSAMEDADWDTHCDSAFIDNPVVQAVIKKLHPTWVEDE